MFPQATHLNPAGWVHLGFFGLVLPYLAWNNHRRVTGGDRPLPNRLLHFKRAVVEGCIFALFSLAVAKVQRIDLFPPVAPPPVAWLGGLAAYAAAVIFMRPWWRRAVERRARVVHLFMPSSNAERAWWIAVALVAGIGEEITWRGAQLALVAALTGSYRPAALLCAVSFGMAHLVQGWKASAVIVVFGLGFHLLVWLGGSLYVAMLAHIAYDITAGISYGRLGRQHGYAGAAAGPQPLQA